MNCRPKRQTEVCRTSANSNRGRIALSPSQPGLNPRSPRGHRT